MANIIPLGIDSVTGQYKVLSPADSVANTGGQTVNRTAIAAGNYSVLVSDYIVSKTGITGGGDTVTLPSAAASGEGAIYIIKDESGTAYTNNISIDTGGGNIDGAASQVIDQNYMSLTIYCNGSDYFII